MQRCTVVFGGRDMFATGPHSRCRDVVSRSQNVRFFTEFLCFNRVASPLCGGGRRRRRPNEDDAVDCSNDPGQRRASQWNPSRRACVKRTNTSVSPRSNQRLGGGGVGVTVWGGGVWPGVGAQRHALASELPAPGPETNRRDLIIKTPSHVPRLNERMPSDPVPTGGGGEKI